MKEEDVIVSDCQREAFRLGRGVLPHTVVGEQAVMKHMQPNRLREITAAAQLRNLKRPESHGSVIK